jgi:hypothetical protein
VSLSDGGISKEEVEEGGRPVVCLLRRLQRAAEGIYFSFLLRKVVIYILHSGISSGSSS